MIDVIFFRPDGSIAQVSTLLTAAEADATAWTRLDEAWDWIEGVADPATQRIEIIDGIPTVVPRPPDPPPPPPTPEEILAAERARMRVYRLAWEDAASMLTYGPGTLLEAIDALLEALPPILMRRYRNITIFERMRPEVTDFLMNPMAINLPPAAVDALFRLGMALEEQRTGDVPTHLAEWEAAFT